METNALGMLSVQEAAVSKGVHQETVRRAIRAGRLPAVRIGRNFVIRQADLHEWRPEYEKASGRPSIGDRPFRYADAGRRRSAPLKSKSDGTARTELPSRHNLSTPTTAILGRERELETVCAYLLSDGKRLVSLTGPGGSGKTRLALEVAAKLSDAFEHGVWFVDLAPLSDASQILSTIAETLDVRAPGRRPVREILIDWLRNRHVLLMLDNCEHVLAGASQVTDLVRAAARLQVLATSRAPLHVAEEQVMPLMPLRLPDLSQASSAVSIEAFAAVQLFVQRARSVSPSFQLTDENARAVTEICTRLDGLPLAIELAAAWVRVLSVEQIATRLDDRFRLLRSVSRTAMPRQQSLRATIDWSHALLTEAERVVFHRLSVFSGGWTIDAAEFIAAGDDVQSVTVLDLLAQLVDKSLVIAEAQHAAARYRLHESIRQYAEEQLHATGEFAATKDRHLDYFLKLAEEAERKLRGHEHQQFLNRLEEEHPNLRAALDWALRSARDDRAAQRLSGALAWFWWLRSYLPEGRQWIQRALSQPPGPPAAHLKALCGEGILAHFQRDTATANQRLSEALVLAREENDRWSEAWILHFLGRVAYYEDDPAGARSLGEKSLALAAEIDDDWLVAWALHLLGLAAHIAADYSTARAYYERSLSIRQELGYREGTGILHCLLGLVSIHEGDVVQALTLLREGIPNSRGIQGPLGMAMPLAASAHVAASLGQSLRAVRLGGAVVKTRDSTQMSIVPIFETLLHEALDMATQDLDKEEFDAAWKEGCEMPLERAVDEALAIELPPSKRAVRRHTASSFETLTAAQHRVLCLLAEGMTSKEIAAELFISVSTVDRHLTHIYGKLGVRNRAEATALALKQRLI